MSENEGLYDLFGVSGMSPGVLGYPRPGAWETGFGGGLRRDDVGTEVDVPKEHYGIVRTVHGRELMGER